MIIDILFSFFCVEHNCRKRWTNLKVQYIKIRNELRNQYIYGLGDNLEEKQNKFIEKYHNLFFLNDYCIDENIDVEHLTDNSEDDGTNQEAAVPNTQNEMMTNIASNHQVSYTISDSQLLQHLQSQPAITMFFLSIASTVSSFTQEMQSKTKAEILSLVNRMEMQNNAQPIIENVNSIDFMPGLEGICIGEDSYCNLLCDETIANEGELD